MASELQGAHNEDVPAEDVLPKTRKNSGQEIWGVNTTDIQ